MDAVQRCLAADEPRRPAAATWIVENVSLGGMRVRLPMGPEDQLRIGTLLGMRPDGGENWLVGVVRRFARRDDLAGQSGSRNLVAQAALGRGRGRKYRPRRSCSIPSMRGRRCASRCPATSRIRPLRAEVLGTTLALEPVELLERGVEFELGRYRVTG